MKNNCRLTENGGQRSLLREGCSVRGAFWRPIRVSAQARTVSYRRIGAGLETRSGATSCMVLKGNGEWCPAGSTSPSRYHTHDRRMTIQRHRLLHDDGHCIRLSFSARGKGEKCAPQQSLFKKRGAEYFPLYHETEKQTRFFLTNCIKHGRGNNG